jgi:hypothetical protein
LTQHTEHPLSPGPGVRESITGRAQASCEASMMNMISSLTHLLP